MKLSHPIFAVLCIAFLLQACASNTAKGPTQVATNFIHQQEVVSTTKETYPQKSPRKVALYINDKTPHTAYRVIGVATVSKYNLLGWHREDKTIHEMMKTLAASIGGDGIINLDSKGDEVKANVIAFQKILI